MEQANLHHVKEELQQTDLNQKLENQPKDYLPELYWKIFDLSEDLLSVCEKHNIPVFLDWGTLIGFLRHNGIIPWDNDADFGIFNKDRSRFLEIYEKGKRKEININVNAYQDEGCLYNTIDNCDNQFIDITFYQEKENIIDSMMNEKTKSERKAVDDYTFPKSLFLPLKEIIFLGHNAYIPFESPSILQIEYGPNWTKYPENFQNFIVEKYLKSPFRDICEIQFENFQQLVRLTEERTEPFIIRDFPLLHSTEKEFEDFLINEKSEFYGWPTSNFDSALTMSPSEAWIQFNAKTLKINIVDSPIQDNKILKEDWKTHSQNLLGENFEYASCYVLTLASKVSEFHTDPEYAGGYMKLLKGNKIWWFITSEDYLYLKSKGHDTGKMHGITMSRLLQLENGYLFGRVIICRVKSNDFIWFPKNTPHKVITIEDSYGYGGYL